MSWKTAENLIRKHGIDGVVKWAEMRNAGRKLEDVARFFGISESRASRIENAIFEKRFCLRDGSVEVINFHKAQNEYQHKSVLRILPPPPH